jgi:hypothetical protein
MSGIIILTGINRNLANSPVASQEHDKDMIISEGARPYSAHWSIMYRTALSFNSEITGHIKLTSRRPSRRRSRRAWASSSLCSPATKRSLINCRLKR